jgi:hypothetical protein
MKNATHKMGFETVTEFGLCTIKWVYVCEQCATTRKNQYMYISRIDTLGPKRTCTCCK